MKNWSTLYLFQISGLKIIYFPTVARHDDRPQKFLLGQVLLLTGQNIGEKANLSLCNFLFVNIHNLIVFYKVGCLFKNESLNDRSTWPASETFGQSNCHSGQTLSVDRPLSTKFGFVLLGNPTNISLLVVQV